MHRVLKFVSYIFGVAGLVFIATAVGLAVYISQIIGDIPDSSDLEDYKPPVLTRIHAADGQLISEFAKERRLFLSIKSVPDLLVKSYLAAEDKSFFQHNGLDFVGIMNAAVQNIINYGTGKRPIGASTITQQVAKNFFFTNEVSYERKIKEAILAIRLERTYSKETILELYLNEIYLGLQAYGVASAALAYFDKAVDELTLPEMAYLAALPKAPNNYHPINKPENAIDRRNWVLDRMMANGFIDEETAEVAKTAPLNFNPRLHEKFLTESNYFVEEVRRELIELYGENSLYAGGLSVRTSIIPEYQKLARKVLMNGLIDFDRKRGNWRGPIENVDLNLETNWQEVFKEVSVLDDVPEWSLAVVTSVTNSKAEIGIRPTKHYLETNKEKFEIGELFLSEMSWARNEKRQQPKTISDVLKVGDIVYVEQVISSEGDVNKWELRQLPEVSGALIAMDPHTGRILALSGGFSYSESEFNRATQAQRQPGSSFKPFVYAAALENGYTPSSVIMDAPIEHDQGAGLGIWRPSNYSNEYFGPTTLRIGIEKSRNVMTVRLAKDMGMEQLANIARRFGIYDNMPQVLSMALGAGETTVMRLTAAYGMLANGGKKITPSLIDRVQDRYGRTVFTHVRSQCFECTVDSWDGQSEPEIIDNQEQVINPLTAYQITSMLEGVVERGTGRAVQAVGKPIAGKTGTTNNEKDAWFIGYSPDLAVGVFIGYDTPRSMGRGGTGGQVAAPVFTEFMKEALADEPSIEFRAPRGIEFKTINRKTGMLATPGAPDSILEAFKPGTKPPDSYSIIGFQQDFSNANPNNPLSPEAEQGITGGTGGLY